MKLYIIGAGPGDERYLTGEARAAIVSAGAVIATPRLAEALGHLNQNTRVCPLAEIPAAILEEEGKDSVAVLVSGDSGFYSLAASLPDKLRGLEGLVIERIAGLSSLQYLCARLGESYEDVRCVSLHGRGGSILPWVSYNRKIFALTGGEQRAQHLIRELCEAGLGSVRVCVGESLGQGASSASDNDFEINENFTAFDGPQGREGAELASDKVDTYGKTETGCKAGLRERILDDTASNLLGLEFSDLACLLIINENCANPRQTLTDADFIRSGAAGLGDEKDGKIANRASGRSIPMTKQAVRALALAALDVQPGHTVLDVGAGTGSVSIELARRVFEGLAFAVERNPDALELLWGNREKLGAFNLRVLAGEAPEALLGLPPVDRAFIGGSGGKLPEIIQAILRVNSQARLVVTAITLETLAEALDCFKKHGLEAEVACINAAYARQAGGYNMMRAENPVYIISGGGHAV